MTLLYIEVYLSWWYTEDVRKATIEPGIGVVSPRGDMWVQVDKNTIFKSL
jgi:hypothetical protein